MSVIGIVGEGRGFCGGGVSASRGRRGGESGIELNSDYYYNTMGDQDGSSGHDNGPGLPTFDTSAPGIADGSWFGIERTVQSERVSSLEVSLTLRFQWSELGHKDTGNTPAARLKT